MWSIALYAVFPYTVQMASYGLREPAKTFFLLLSALGLVKIKSNARDITGFTLTGIACGLGMLIRADTVLTAIAVLAVAAGIDTLHDVDILGSVAGDDCIIVVSRSEEASKNITNKILKIAGK